jgi:uncharacterized protein YkwD
MKKVVSLIVSILIFVSNSYSQSALETEFVKQLNIYRKKHGLGPVKYDSGVSNVALYHSNYINECKKVGHVVNSDKLPHDEEFDINNYKELNFEQRADMLPNKNIWGEITIPANSAKKSESIESIAKNIIASFDSSPHHKEIMLEEDAPAKFIDIVGVSIIKSSKDLGQNYDEYIVNVDFGFVTP